MTNKIFDIKAKNYSLICTLKWLVPFALLLSSAAHADLYYYAKVSCDKQKNELTVEQLTREDEEPAPSGSDVVDLLALTEMKTISNSAGSFENRVKKEDFKKECSIGDQTYKILISPWKYTSAVNGMCGGASPSIELTIWRGKNKILDKLVFSGYCNPPESLHDIDEIRFSETEKSAFISIGADSGHQEKKVPYDKLSNIDRNTIFSKN